MPNLTIPTVNIRAIERPDYLNARMTFVKWHSDNWERLAAYFEQCGGETGDVSGYLDFAKCQFDMQQVSQLDIKLLNEVREENEQRRARADIQI